MLPVLLRINEIIGFSLLNFNKFARYLFALLSN